jgi:hypothetical protein
MMDLRLPPDRVIPAGQAPTARSTPTDPDQQGPLIAGANNAVVLETSFSAFPSTRTRLLKHLSLPVFAQLDNKLAVDVLLLLLLACSPWNFTCLVLVFAGLAFVGMLHNLRIPTLFVLGCRPSTPWILASEAQPHGDARSTAVEVPAKTPLHGSYEKDSSQRHFSTSPNSPRRNLPGKMATLPFIGDDHTTTRGCPYSLDEPMNAGGTAILHTRRMLILLSTGDDLTTKRGCPYTLDAPWVSGRINTLPCHLHDLVLHSILNCWEGCLLMWLLYFVLFCACLVRLSMDLILPTPRLIGDARSPETLYQIQGQAILFEPRSRCSMGCLCHLVFFSV